MGTHYCLSGNCFSVTLNLNITGLLSTSVSLSWWSFWRGLKTKKSCDSTNSIPGRGVLTIFTTGSDTRDVVLTSVCVVLNKLPDCLLEEGIAADNILTIDAEEAAEMESGAATDDDDDCCPPSSLFPSAFCCLIIEPSGCDWKKSLSSDECPFEEAEDSTSSSGEEWPDGDRFSFSFQSYLLENGMRWAEEDECIKWRRYVT